MIRRIEESAIQGAEYWERWRRLTIHRDDELTWTETDIPFAIFNSVLRCSLQPENLDRRLDELTAPGRPMIFWVVPSTKPDGIGARLEAKGWRHADTTTAMALDLNRLNEGVARPPELQIREVLTNDELEIWAALQAPVYGLPDFAAKAWLELHESLGLGEDKPLRHFMGWIGDKPVATASLFTGSGVAAVSSVATLPEARKQGIGSAITLHPLLLARHAGLKEAALFSSGMAVNMYARLGFQVHGHGEVFVSSGT